MRLDKKAYEIRMQGVALISFVLFMQSVQQFFSSKEDKINFVYCPQCGTNYYRNGEVVWKRIRHPSQM